jgi:hypothetical protein
MNSAEVKIWKKAVVIYPKNYPDMTEQIMDWLEGRSQNCFLWYQLQFSSDLTHSPIQWVVWHLPGIKWSE